MRGSTSSDKRKKVAGEESNQEDRLSALPDALIDHIFSFLNMRVVVKTCILSSKWRYLWLSTSNLNFDNDEVICDSLGCCKCSVECKCESCDIKRAGFSNFVERVLFLITKSNIVNFNLISTCSWLEPDHVCSWINTALGLKSQNIVIGITPHKPLEIPACLFTSNVEKLKLSCYTKPARTTFPSTVHRAEHLKSLALNYLLFPDGNVEGELILSFPVLEYLEIWKCNATHLKILSISAPLLERLELAKICTDKYSSCKVKICAPNLTSVKLIIHLKWSSSPVEYCMENPSHLICADIRIRSYYSENSAKECVKCWTEVLSWTCNVQCLKLVTSSVQSLVGSPRLLERLPEIFYDLEHVTIEENCRTSFGAVLNFLERVPCIKTLILKREFRYHEVGEKWTVNLPLKEIFTGLETFEFRNFNGWEVEMQFLELLLERAAVIKKITIKTSKWLLEKHKRRILSFPRASSSASILFSKMVYLQHGRRRGNHVIAWNSSKLLVSDV